ncbi:gamma-glutamylcyclotransferase family protein [Desulfovulcanus sp.]
MSHFVFVYGTLKKGYSNHHFLLDASFIGPGRTQNKYTMYADSIPYVSPQPQTSYIYGELYLVNDDTLRALDQLEEHPDFYVRRKVPVVIDAKTYLAWMYFARYPSGSIVPLGCWEPEGGFSERK